MSPLGEDPWLGKHEALRLSHLLLAGVHAGLPSGTEAVGPRLPATEEDLEPPEDEALPTRLSSTQEQCRRRGGDRSLRAVRHTAVDLVGPAALGEAGTPRRPAQARDLLVGPEDQGRRLVLAYRAELRVGPLRCGQRNRAGPAAG